MSDLTIRPIGRPFDLTFAPPGSKSLTNRALALAALGEGECRIANALLAEDTRVMVDGLRRLGVDVAVDEGAPAILVQGRGGAAPARGGELFCGNSGTTIRFLTALCALGRGRFVLDGVPRMRQRPIGELLDLLRNLGVRAASIDGGACPPVRVDADGLPGGIARFGAAASSQFLSSVLHVAPYARHETEIDLDPGQTSWPYVAMTMRLMDLFGVTPELIRDPATDEPRRIIIPRGRYACAEHRVEPDASAASYFLALAALHPGSRVVLEGLGSQSLQGDVQFAGVLRRMGAAVRVEPRRIICEGAAPLEGIDIDLSGMPDVAQTLAATALFAEGESVLRGLRTLRVKETDRLAAVVAELTRLGAEAETDGDALRIRPPARVVPARVATYDDHRMAMSFALVGTRVDGVVIGDAECVRKTYPGYFDDLRRFGVESA